MNCAARHVEPIRKTWNGSLALKSHSKRSPITPSSRSAGGYNDELERLWFALTEPEKESENLRNALRELADRLELESKQVNVVETQYKAYNQQMRSAEVARKKAEADATR